MLPAVALAAASTGPDRWLADTGASYDLIGEKHLTRKELDNIELSDVTIEMDSANGNIYTNEFVPMRIPGHPSQPLCAGRLPGGALGGTQV